MSTRLEVLATRMQVVTTALMIATPILFALGIVMDGVAGQLPVPPRIAVDISRLGLPAMAAVIALAAVKPAAFLPALWFLRRLFGLYRRGRVFEHDAVVCIERIGWSLVAIDGVAILQRAAAGPLLTALGASDGWFSIGIGVVFAVIGLFVVVIARVMDMGRALKEQDELTI